LLSENCTLNTVNQRVSSVKKRVQKYRRKFQPIKNLSRPRPLTGWRGEERLAARSGRSCSNMAGVRGGGDVSCSWGSGDASRDRHCREETRTGRELGKHLDTWRS